jgi:membrane protease YdiL (CAAX protease family)
MLTKKTYFIVSFLILIRLVPYEYIFHGNGALLLLFLKVYQVITYLLIAYLIFLEKDNLRTFHIDRISIMIFLLFRTILFINWRSVGYLDFAILGINIITAIVLFTKLRNGVMREPILLRNIGWIIVGLFFGTIYFGIQFFTVLFIFTGKPTIYLNFFQIQSIGLFLFGFVRSLGNEAIDEEPIFRGFLWGYLRQIGLNEKWIWIIQGFLFWTAHSSQLLFGQISFWFGLPFGLLLGWLSWRSRSITSSMSAHAIFNTAVSVLKYNG